MKRDILITVVDGQGGGIGKAIVLKLKSELPNIHIRALGTNSAATNAMLKAGAADGATGENAIVCNVRKADIIIGVLAILMPNSLLGELTPKMAEAIGSSDAQKILIPVDRCNIHIPFAENYSIQQLVDGAVSLAKQTAAKLAE